MAMCDGRQVGAARSVTLKNVDRGRASHLAQCPSDRVLGQALIARQTEGDAPGEFRDQLLLHVTPQ